MVSLSNRPMKGGELSANPAVSQVTVILPGAHGIKIAALGSSP